VPISSRSAASSSRVSVSATRPSTCCASSARAGAPSPTPSSACLTHASAPQGGPRGRGPRGRAVRQGEKPPPPRTKWTRRVPHSVLIGHAASLSQVECWNEAGAGAGAARACASCSGVQRSGSGSRGTATPKRDSHSASSLRAARRHCPAWGTSADVPLAALTPPRARSASRAIVTCCSLLRPAQALQGLLALARHPSQVHPLGCQPSTSFGTRQASSQEGGTEQPALQSPAEAAGGEN
jgi:hypothetical protein